MAKVTRAAQSGLPADETRDPTFPASITWANDDTLHKCFETEELILEILAAKGYTSKTYNHIHV